MFALRTIAVVALAALAIIPSTSASPVPLRASGPLDSSMGKRDFFCDVKNVQCCDQMMSHADAAKSFGDLLAIPDGLVGQVGLGCTPIGLTASSQCKSTPVCCSTVSQSGLINAGCSPLSVA